MRHQVLVPMQKIKVAVIGVGHLGCRHAQIYQEIKNCCLAAVCDIDKNRLNQISGNLKVKGYTDYKDLLNKVDAVSIATPTNLHYRIAYDFLKHNVHVLVEKPFTANIKEADFLIKTAAKFKLILQVGHIERFNCVFTAIQKIVKEPRFIECHRLSPFPNRSLDIGVVLDLMIHDIDIVLGLVNSTLKRIEAVGVPVLTKFEDIANSRLTFKSGCVANLTASRVSDEWMRKIRIFQKDTYISLDYKDAKGSVYKKKGFEITKVDLPIERQDPLKKELQSFLNCITEHEEPLVSGTVAREALSVAIEIQNQIWQESTS